MIILAVESSCDETSVAVVQDGKKILSNIVSSQINIHQKFGGIVPEVASRNHVRNMIVVFDQAIKESKVTITEIDAIAVTYAPGLIGSLLVGINAATAFALANGKPIIPVNHLLGHIYSGSIDNELKFPAVCLLISGGHTELLYIREHLKIEILGTTLDDAVGEAYDKVARTLGLEYPGGPVIDYLSTKGMDKYELPRPLDDGSLNFSFSGLKSAVINKIHNLNQKGLPVDVNDMCASFQMSVIDVLVSKTKLALEKTGARQLIVAGGVAANEGLRKRLKEEVLISTVIPKLEYCTDNAAMIGVAAYYICQNTPAEHDYLIAAKSTGELKTEEKQ